LGCAVHRDFPFYCAFLIDNYGFTVKIINLILRDEKDDLPMYYCVQNDVDPCALVNCLPSFGLELGML
jgi:hypothetical protein